MVEYILATLRRMIPSNPRKHDCFPDPGTPSLAQGEGILFHVFCQINSHVALSEETFVVPPRASTCSIASPILVASYNASTNAMSQRTRMSYTENILKSMWNSIPFNSTGWAIHMINCNIQFPGSASDPSRPPSVSLASPNWYPSIIGLSD